MSNFCCHPGRAGGPPLGARSWFRNSLHRGRESIERISDHKRRQNHKFAGVVIESEVRSEGAAKYSELRIRDTSGSPCQMKSPGRGPAMTDHVKRQAKF